MHRLMIRAWPRDMGSLIHLTPMWEFGIVAFISLHLWNATFHRNNECTSSINTSFSIFIALKKVQKLVFRPCYFTLICFPVICLMEIGLFGTCVFWVDDNVVHEHFILNLFFKFVIRSRCNLVILLNPFLLY